MTINAFELGRLLYESRIIEAWDFDKTGSYAEHRLTKLPYPNHPADARPECQSASVELAQAQAKALLKQYKVEALD